ncbi:autotransporter secretion outer membrane protein TamA [Sinobacterium caligoides]|uniref:Translocation and assembly module subunit TamA n=2 Tax=Sinobacterium caligoides TaxID=933926 RepID=A0A3N2DZ97_9GAMM|nr:autotransporter secretion outer membrane protein TamA [Sinobacterium caligoides]
MTCSLAKLWVSGPVILLLSLLVTFSPVSEAKTHKVKVSIEGTSDTLGDNILAHIGKLNEEQLEQPQLLQQQLEKAVVSAARAIGYYHSQFNYRIDKHKHKLMLTVWPGPRAVFVDPILEIHGDAAKIQAFTKAQKRSKLKAGKPLSHRQYDAYKQHLLSLADDYGFFDAKFTKSEFRVDREAGTGQPVLIFESGQRYRFGEVNYAGSMLDDELLEQLIPFKRGDLVSRDVLLEVNRNLLDTNYFEEVNIERDLVRGTHTLNLGVLLQDSNKSRYEVGVGYSTDYGTRLRFGWDKSLVNNKGHSVSFNSEWSKPKKELEASYNIPWHHPLNKYIKLSTGYQVKDVEDSETELLTSAISFYDKHDSGWVFGYSWEFDLENYRQGDEDVNHAAYMLPGFNLGHSEIPENRDPARGHRFDSYFRGSSRALGAEVAFLKGYVSYRQLMPLINHKTLLLLRGELGAIETDNILKVPVSRRFFAGGDNSIRGYAYESVSERDSKGVIVGGSYLNTFSAELSYRVLKNWRIATFADTGRAYTNNDEPFSTGVGFGVRWLSPIGQIRVDLAHPLDDPDTQVMLHIAMGPPL